MQYKKQLFNKGWQFLKLPVGSTLEDAEKRKSEFRPIGLPHDWLIYQTKNLYEDSVGWYQKTYDCQKREDESVSLRFDGIYMDSVVYVNGREAKQWKYGYSAFDVDLTPFLWEGQNEITIKVNHQSPNSRWYSGAGIYRDVWIRTTHNTHIPWDGVYVTAEIENTEKNIWKLVIETELVSDRAVKLEYGLVNKKAPGDRLVLGHKQVKPCKGIQTVHFDAAVENPAIWDVDSPVCYEVSVRIFDEQHETLLQEENVTWGFRAFYFDPEKGFMLNGRKLKINGVCEHHDLGCLGAAYHSDAMRRKMEKLKSMGVNGIRFAHNMASEDAMELADEMGFVVISEAFDMWERKKTEYDYARFFDEWYQKDIASWVRRDRNHPCVIMWCIGNEIYDTQADERGQEITRLLSEEVRKHDPKGQAMVTIASNYMSGKNAQKCADIIKLTGYNYSERFYSRHHEQHSDWILYGSETGSIVQSRGVYHFPYSQACLADEDLQCSCLGNSVTSWGAKSIDACITAERDHDFSCGQFIWTGFDYIGEPTPYHTKNSYFGQIDTAGFEKDSFYQYQSEWTRKDGRPMVHLFPYWDFNEGQIIDVMACTSEAAVELFVNGKSCGICPVDHVHGTKLCAHWQVPYEKGCIRAVAYDEKGAAVARDERHSFGEPAKLVLTTEKKVIKNKGQELNFIAVTAVDGAGHIVENAGNRINVEEGDNAVLIGLDNGDSTDMDAYKGHSKRLFNGKLLIVMAAKDSMRDAVIKVSSKETGLEGAEIAIQVCDAGDNDERSLEGMKTAATIEQCCHKETEITIPVRNIYLSSSNGTKLNKTVRDTVVYAEIAPENATDKNLIWSVVNDAGIPIEIAGVEPSGEKAIVKAASNGKFRLRCMSKSGDKHVRIISSLEFEVTGLGEAFKNPYHFISAGLFDYVIGDIGNGNERGIASSRLAESGVGYHKIDFGRTGSDEITLPIFGMSDAPHRIRIYEGMADQESAELLADVIYQKPAIWNVYQEDTFKLNRVLTGIKDISFLFEEKLHLKGFVFTKQSCVSKKIPISMCDKVYGDHYIREETKIREIGNNVTLEFHGMEFGEEGTTGVDIAGYTPNPDNSIQLRFVDGEREELRTIVFVHTEQEGVQSFGFPEIKGTWDVFFVFLPGSNFDFDWFRFC